MHKLEIISLHQKDKLYKEQQINQNKCIIIKVATIRLKEKENNWKEKL